ncbi:MAG: sulfatase [Bacteroidales bacterium]
MQIHTTTRSRLVVLTLGLALALGGCKGTSGEETHRRPNIVFIMSDDHAYQAISAYGGELAGIAPTPNIDRIANEGMRFERCMVTNSICGPSRATILSGKYSHKNGFVDNTMGSKFDFNQLTFTKVLLQAGYKTAMIGKLHLGETPTGFDYFDILPGQGNYYNPTFINETGEYEMEGYTTEIIADKTIAWIESVKDGEQPFLVMMQHKAPHRAWDPGPAELGMFDGVTIPEPESLFDDYSGNRVAASKNFMSISDAMTIDRDLKMTDQPRGNLTEEQQKAWDAVYGPVYEDFLKTAPKGDDLVRFKYQRYMKDYLSCIAAVDKSVGEVLDYLEASGLAGNTIVVYTSDQGFYLGEHGWFDKRWMYKESLHTPLLIKWPGVTEAGSVNSDLVSNLDFGETFIDIAGSDIPEEMQGASLVPILQGNTPADWRTGHYYHYYEHPSEHNVMRHYGITTEKYKLMHMYYDEDSWELYDLEKDPHEMNNVYGIPEYASVQEDLHRQLEDLRVQYEDSDSLNQKFIEEYQEKVKENPFIEYWKLSREDMQRLFQARAQEEESDE